MNLTAALTLHSRRHPHRGRVWCANNLGRSFDQFFAALRVANQPRPWWTNY